MQHHAVAVLVRDVSDYEVPCSDNEEKAEFYWPQIGVREVRELSGRAHLRPSSTSMQVLVVRTSFITHEAQNALLKLFEEPPRSTRFELVVATDIQFLPTLRSRLTVRDNGNDVTIPNEWRIFVAQSLGDRMKEIEARIKSKDVDWQRAIKSGLTVYLRTSSRQVVGKDRERLYFVANHLLTRGASNKMLLEELALTVQT